jgi:hypothetical protein
MLKNYGENIGVFKRRFGYFLTEKFPGAAVSMFS